MAQFDFFEIVGTEGFLVDIQADLLDHLTTRVVVPLLPAAEAPSPVGHLHPRFELEGVSYILATHLLSAVPAVELKARRGSLAHRRYDIIHAIDALLSGV